MPITDPDRLFEDRKFQEYGALLWPDHFKARAENPIWTVVNMTCQDELEVESAQLMFDKSKKHVIEGLLMTYYMTY